VTCLWLWVIVIVECGKRVGLNSFTSKSSLDQLNSIKHHRNSIKLISERLKNGPSSLDKCDLQV